MTAALVAAAVLVLVVLRSRRTVASPVLARLRVLLPAWRFFDRAEPAPLLLVRAGAGAWTPLAAGPRGWTTWAFAPRGNLALAYHAAVAQLVADVDALDAELPDDDPAITGLVAYELVTRIAREAAGGAPFAWKVVVDGADYLAAAELAA